MEISTDNNLSESGIRPFRRVLDLIRGAGLRPTRQRLALGRLLFDDGNRHVTAEILHAEAVAARVRASLATVYNTLHQFTDGGLLRRVMVDSLRSYFDTNVTDHHHFFFEDTGEIADIPPDKFNWQINQTINGISPSGLPVGTALSRIDVVVRLRAAD